VNSTSPGTACLIKNLEIAYNKMSDIYTRNMLSKIRGTINESPKELPKSGMITEQDNLNSRFRILMEEATENSGVSDGIVISIRDTQFGNVRSSQENMLCQTIPSVSFKEDALKYYPQNGTTSENLVLNGSIEGIGITFQFKYKDSSGDGCYIWADAVQLSEENVKTIAKVRSAFENWRDSINKDGELLSELRKWATKN
jgi:hypothetical protein